MSVHAYRARRSVSWRFGAGAACRRLDGERSSNGPRKISPRRSTRCSLNLRSRSRRRLQPPPRQRRHRRQPPCRRRPQRRQSAVAAPAAPNHGNGAARKAAPRAGRPPRAAAPTVPPVTPAEQLTAKAKRLRSGAQQSLHDHRHHLRHDQPRHHRGAAARHQRAGRESAVCRRRACRRIPRPAGCFMSATITPMCNSASTASCCPTASPASAAYSTPA